MKTLNLLYNKYKNSPFTYSEAIEAGVTRHTFNVLLKNNDIMRIHKNIYVLAAGDITEEDIFKGILRYLGKPSIICLLSALSYYDLIDVIPKKTWVFVPEKKQSSRKDIRLIRTKHLNWDIGVIYKNGFYITSLERTLVDSLVYQKKLGLQIAVSALKKALKEKQTTLNKVYDIAKKLKLEGKIEQYIKVLM